MTKRVTWPKLKPDPSMTKLLNDCNKKDKRKKKKTSSKDLKFTIQTDPKKTLSTSIEVIKPAYYTSVHFQALDVIEDWGLDFILGNVLKYIQRAGRKPSAPYLEDLKKAWTYLGLKIERLEKQQIELSSD